MKKYLVPALLAALLAACGGSSNNGNSAMAPSTTNAFITIIQTQFMGMSDEADVASIDSIQVVSPENTEPVAI